MDTKRLHFGFNAFRVDFVDASRIERDGQSWFRVAVTAKTIMTSLGPVTYRRARYRSGASGASPVPVDESLGLVDDYLTRPAADERERRFNESASFH